jgi:hypothetical protein
MGNNTPNNNRIDQITSDQSLIAGFIKHASGLTSMAILGATQTTKDIVATLQSRIDSARAVDTTRAAWQVAVQADRALRDKTKTFVSVVKQSLLATFAGQLDALADFGLTARHVHVATPAEKLAAAAKAKATREARHTMGSKQKAAIKGTVTPTAPATSSPTAPAPSPVQPVGTPAAPVPSTTQPVTPAAAPIAPAPSPVTPAPSQTATPIAGAAPRVS